MPRQLPGREARAKIYANLEGNFYESVRWMAQRRVAAGTAGVAAAARRAADLQIYAGSPVNVASILCINTHDNKTRSDWIQMLVLSRGYRAMYHTTTEPASKMRFSRESRDSISCCPNAVLANMNKKSSVETTPAL